MPVPAVRFARLAPRGLARLRLPLRERGRLTLPPPPSVFQLHLQAADPLQLVDDHPILDGDLTLSRNTATFRCRRGAGERIPGEPLPLLTAPPPGSTLTPVSRTLVRVSEEGRAR